MKHIGKEEFRARCRFLRKVAKGIIPVLGVVAVAKKSILMLLFVSIAALYVFADTSPNGREYTVKQGELYFNKIVTKSYNHSDTTYELVDAEYIENMVIPDEIEGYKVTSILEWAFENRVDIESVAFNPSMKKVRGAFHGCIYINKVDMSQTKDMNLGRLCFAKSSLEEVELPEGLDGEYVFNECTSLKEIVFMGVVNNTSSWFSGCTALTDVQFCEGMTYVGGFNGCTSLTSVKLPSTTIEIGYYAFEGCTSLTNVDISDVTNLQIINSHAFENVPLETFEVPRTVTGIYENAFAYTKLEHFNVPAGLLKQFPYGGELNLDRVFTGCQNMKVFNYPSLEKLFECPPDLYTYGGLGKVYDVNGSGLEITINGEPLEELTFPGTVTTIHEYNYLKNIKRVVIQNSTNTINMNWGFGHCPDLEYVELGAGSHEMDGAFEGCKSLKTVVVSPKNRTEILSNAFVGCTSLETINFPNVKTINGSFRNCESLKSVDFPKLTEIKDESFRNCKSLEEVDFPLLTTFGQCAFEGCSSLKRVNLPLCTNISRYSFRNCTSLNDVTFGENIEIEEQAFKGCESLESFDFSKVKIFNADAFYNTGLVNVVLPKGIRTNNRSIFKDCQKLSSIEAEEMIVASNKGDVIEYSISGCPKLERVHIKGNMNYFSCSSSMADLADGTIILDGDVNSIGVYSLDGLNKLVFNGKIGTVSQVYKTSVKEIHIRSLEYYLAATLTEWFGRDNVDKATISLFIGGNSVSDIEIPAGTTLQAGTFQGFNLTSVTFAEGEGETTIGNQAFMACKNLKTVNINGNVVSIGADAFRQCGLEYVELPDCVRTLGVACFQQNSQLKHITFPTSVTTIPDGVIYNCPLIESLVIPEGVERIGYNITDGKWNTNLKVISLPSTLKSLYTGRYESFSKVSPNVEVWSWAALPPEAGIANFDNNTVHVPYGSGSAYKADRMWMNAIIVDDAEKSIDVSTSTDASGATIVISLPQNEINTLAQVTRYIVDLYKMEDGEKVLVETYEIAMQPETNKMIARTAEFNDNSIVIDNLEVATEYVFDVKGYTQFNDLISMHSGSITTINNTSSVKEVEEYITIEGVYTTSGLYLGDSLENIEDGIYIVRYSDGTVKKLHIKL